jgi:UDP-GlcNAc:undecaprenyl-phosphate GlcNAc-1-phosphate transferase
MGSLLKALLALLTAAGVAFLATPFVIRLARKIGAMDVPKDGRRMHKLPIPRLGGLAIFLGFVVAVLIFVKPDLQTQGILMGAIIIVIMGAVDDAVSLKPVPRLVIQTVAALIPVLSGVRVQYITNFNFLSPEPYHNIGFFSIPATIIWIVGLTNAVNWIDGLDGLAVGVSTTAAFSMFIVSLFVAPNSTLPIIVAALAGACLGFIPYNLNPAKIFMGDTGSMFLGFILATLSVQGLFKFYAVISFAVPFLILGLPIFDTAITIIRRIMRGKSPMQADRGHLHHRLIDMGLSQKQAVALMYSVSGALGIIAVVLTSSGEVKAILLLVAILVLAGLGAAIIHGRQPPKDKDEACPAGPSHEQKDTQPSGRETGPDADV